MDSNGKTCWVTQIKELLCKNGFQYIWTNQYVDNIRCFLSSLKQRMIDSFLQAWTASVRDSERFTLYRTFTDDFFCVDRILDIDVPCFRKALCHLRFGVLPINNNKHRYSNSMADKMCPFCLIVVEDEIHFVQHCPMYSNIRNDINIDICGIRLCNLMDRKHLHFAKAIAKFTFLAMKYRQRLLDSQL